MIDLEKLRTDLEAQPDTHSEDHAFERFLALSMIALTESIHELKAAIYDTAKCDCGKGGSR